MTIERPTEQPIDAKCSSCGSTEELIWLPYTKDCICQNCADSAGEEADENKAAGYGWLPPHERPR